MVEKQVSNRKKDVSPPAAAGNERRLTKVREGVVVSASMEKTVVVAVVRQVRHATYGKYIRRNEKFLAHDERKECGVGDKVRIVETRPMSRRKRWRVQAIVAKAV